MDTKEVQDRISFLENKIDEYEKEMANISEKIVNARNELQDLRNY